MESENHFSILLMVFDGCVYVTFKMFNIFKRQSENINKQLKLPLSWIVAELLDAVTMPRNLAENVGC